MSGAAASRPPSVLFTGFPGFLGSALLRRVLARGDGPVACLIQPRYRDLAERRARDIVADVEIESEDDAAVQSHMGSDHFEAFQGRIPEFVAGDVELHRFDVSEKSRMM